MVNRKKNFSLADTVLYTGNGNVVAKTLNIFIYGTIPATNLIFDNRKLDKSMAKGSRGIAAIVFFTSDDQRTEIEMQRFRH